MNTYHKEILEAIKLNSGTPTQHTFLDSYLGNDHPRYPINAPTLRLIAREWMSEHRDLPSKEFAAVLDSMVKGKSGTEKCMTGILLDYAKPAQRQFNPKLFASWLNEVKGWAEIDSICTSKYTATEVLNQWEQWEPQLRSFVKSKNIAKRRASIVFLVVPVRKSADRRLADCALDNIEILKVEKDILITKAISWVLRSMIKNHRALVTKYLKENEESLPSIAVREAWTKLKTGTKNPRKA